MRVGEDKRGGRRWQRGMDAGRGEVEDIIARRQLVDARQRLQ